MSSSYVKDKFDLGILRADGTTKVGLMLDRGKDGRIPQWVVYDDEYLAQQFFTGDPGYGSLPAEKEIAIRQDDWRSGFGLETYDGNDPKRYYSSIGMDMRFRGMAIAGPKATTITKPTTSITALATLSNKDFELSASWTGVGGARSSVQKRTGSYSWLPAEDVAVYQNAVTWISGWIGLAFTFRCWAYTSVGSNARIAIQDHVGGVSYSDYHTGAAGWELLSVTRTIDADGTYLQCQLLRDTSDAAYFDDCNIVPPACSGITVTFAEFNDYLYMASGNVLSKMNAGGTAFESVGTFPTTITDLEVFGSYLFIALGTSYPFWYMDTTATPVFAETTLVIEATTAVGKFQFFKTVDAAAPVLWGNDSVNTIRSSVNPLNGGTAWSGVTTVSSSFDSITGLQSDVGALYITKEDMPYYLNSSGAVKNDLAPELATQVRSTDNGKNAFFWLHKFYLPYQYSLLESDSGVNTWLSPSNYFTNLTEFTGKVQAVTGDDKYLYVTLATAGSYGGKLLAGRWETIDGTTEWVWHPILALDENFSETIFISSVFQKRLYLADLQTSEALYYIPLPKNYGNMTADANRSFQTATTMETSWLHGNFKSTMKAFPSLELVMGHTYDADIYFTVGYKKLGDSSWTLIGSGILTNGTGTATGSPISLVGGVNTPTITIAGTFTIVLPTGGSGTATTGGWTVTGSPVTLVAGSNTITVQAGGTGTITVATGIYRGTATSMTQNQFIPAASGVNPKSTMFRLQFTAVTDDTTKTPVLYSYHLKGILYPSQREIIACRIYCANEITLRDGTTDKGSYATVIATLDEARTATWPVTIYDINGDTKYVKFLPLPSTTPRWTVGSEEKGRSIERYYNCLMQIIPLE